MGTIPTAQYVDTPNGRALAVVEALERRVGGHGYTYADLLDFLDPPIASQAEVRWRQLTVGISRWCEQTDRPLVLEALRNRARIWGQTIGGVDADTPDAAPPVTAADPFAGLPKA